MPKGKPKIEVFYRTADTAINPPICIPAKKYCLSLFQVKRLLAKKIICGVKFKRRLYIADIPPDN